MIPTIWSTYWPHAQALLRSNSFWLGLVVLLWNCTPIVATLFPNDPRMQLYLTVVSALAAIAYKALNHTLPVPQKGEPS